MTQHLEEGVLHALLDGEIPAAELPPVEAHLAGCPECRARLDEARAFRDEAERLVGEIEVPDDWEQPAAATGVRRGRRFVRMRWMAYAATLVGALGLGYAARGWVAAPRPDISMLAADSNRGARTVLEAESLPAPVAGPEPALPETNARRQLAPATDLVQQRTDNPAASRGIVGGVASRPATPATDVPAAAPPSASGMAAERGAGVAARDEATKAAQPSAAARRIEGKVTNEAGQGIAGARVTLAGSAVVASTDAEGHYRIEGQLPETSTVVANAIGYQSLGRPAALGDSGVGRLDFNLRAVQYRLEEVVVTGTPGLAAARRGRELTSQPVRASRPSASFQPVDFAEALRRLGGRIRLVDGLVPARIEAAGDTVRVGYQVSGGRGILYLQQFRVGDTVAFALIPPPGFPADSLARITARVKP